MKRLWISTWISTALLLGSCNLPRYVPPAIETPERWRITPVEGEARANLDWWQEFNDPILTELVIHALQNNQEIRIAAARVMQFRALLGIAEADLYPNIQFEARAHRLESSTGLPGGIPPTFPRIFSDFFAAFRLFWELDFWGRIRSATEAAFDDLLASISARQAVTLTIVQDVARGYFTLRGLDAQLVLAQETWESRLKTLELAKIRFELGETSQLEVRQEEAQVEIAALRILQLKRAIPQQENLLSIIVGDPPHTIARGLPLQEMYIAPAIPAGLPSELLYRRPDLLEAEQRLMAASARIAEARALFFPRISLTGLYGFESTQLKSFLSHRSELWDIGVNLAQIVFDAGKVAYTVSLARARTCEAVAQYRQRVLQAFREVEDALITIEMNRKLVAEHAIQIKILKDYLRLANLRYAEGEVDYLNVLDAQRDLFNAQLAAVATLTEELISIVDLYSALGGGWVQQVDDLAEGFLNNEACAGDRPFPDVYEEQEEKVEKDLKEGKKKEWEDEKEVKQLEKDVEKIEEAKEEKKRN